MSSSKASSVSSSIGMAAAEGRPAVRPRRFVEGAFSGDGEHSAGTALTPPWEDVLPSPPVMDSTADLMLGGKTDSNAVSAINLVGLR